MGLVKRVVRKDWFVLDCRACPPYVAIQGLYGTILMSDSLESSQIVI